MAASLAAGTSVLRNVARSPKCRSGEVPQSHGCPHRRRGSDTVTVQGVATLNGAPTTSCRTVSKSVPIWWRPQRRAAVRIEGSRLPRSAWCGMHWTGAVLSEGGLDLPRHGGSSPQAVDIVTAPFLDSRPICRLSSPPLIRSLKGSPL